MRKTMIVMTLAMVCLGVSAQEKPFDGANTYDAEIDGICYHLNPDEQVAEMAYLHYQLGEINGDTDYRFAPESNSSGEECYAVPMDVWERLKTETFYVTAKGASPAIRIIDAWWTSVWTGGEIMPGSELLTDNGDGTWTLAVNFEGDPILDVLDEHHMAFSGCGYSVEEIYLKENNGEGKFTVWKNGTYQSETVKLPEKIAYEGVEYTVTSIGQNAFSAKRLTSVVIPSSVTAIAVRAFDNCMNLTSIKVESGNKVYDSREDCNAIIETNSNILIAGCQSTVIPSSVTEIGESAFFHCSNLTSIVIPNSVTSIGLAAFYGCGLTSLDIPCSVTTIGGYAFTNCFGLTSVSIPGSVTSIGDYAFAFCMEMTTVIIPNSVTSIGNVAFGFCNLTDVYCYAEKVPDTSDGTLFDYSYIEKATLHVPAGSIGDYANTAPWNGFWFIVPLTDDDPAPTGIRDTNSNVMAVGQQYYTIDGKRSTTPKQGMNIVKMNDGTTKKVIVK